jgi:4-amino-4-deoxy-L-arabinose transferase-like glycosyltransferase
LTTFVSSESDPNSLTPAEHAEPVHYNRPSENVAAGYRSDRSSGFALPPFDGGPAIRGVRSIAMDGTTTERHFGWWLALIAGGALFLRFFVVIHFQGSWVGGDGFAYSLQANEFAGGHLYVLAFHPALPSAGHPPAWVTVLGVVALLGGHAWLPQQLVACTIGTVTVVAIGLAGRRIAGARVGLIGAGIGAVYAGLWVYERDLLSETLLLLGIAVTLVLAYWFLDAPSLRLAVALGIMTGLLALTRSEEILVWALLVVPLILTARSVARRRRLGWLAIATASMVIVLAPWTVYNFSRFHHLVALSTNYGGGVSTGNCDPAYYGPYTGFYNLGCLAPVTTTNEAVAETINLRKGTTYAEHHLSRVPAVVLAREGRAFGLWEPFQQTALDSQWQDTPLWVNRLALFTYWLLLVPAAAGIVVMRRRGRAVYPLLAFVAAVVVSVAITYGETRYRAAAEVPLVLLAAVGIDAGLRRKPRADGSVIEEMPRETTTTTQLERVTASAASDSAPSTRTYPIASGVFARNARFVVAIAAMAALFLAGVGAIVGAATTTGPVFGVRIVAPSNAATVSSEQTLAATVTTDFLIKSVTFEARSSSLKTTNIVPAARAIFVWGAKWNTSTLPNGTYQLWCVVHFVTGGQTKSDTIRVVVKHR